jgi:2-iminobutanoate/2-iminopropanoate deaminase
MKERYRIMKVIATEKAPAAIGPYSQAYVNNGVLYTSGQLGIRQEILAEIQSKSRLSGLARM